MPEYIEREAVLKHRRKMSGADFGGEFWDEAVLAETIRSIPSADVVSVVRCKDCKHYNKDTLFGTAYCDGREIKPNDFCSYGERRDDNG